MGLLGDKQLATLLAKFRELQAREQGAGSSG
jgi:hypothetical protein